MFAFGTAGFLAGALYRLGWLSKKRLPLSLLAFCSPSPGGAAIGYLRAVYPDGGDQLGDGQGHLSVWSSDQLHPWGGDLFLTLFFFSRPLFEKLDRVQLKYGMMEDGYGV